MKKILFLGNNDFYGDRIAEHGIDVKNPFKKIFGLLKVFRIIHFKLNIGFKSIWISEIKEIANYGIIILPANEFSVFLSAFIEKIIRNKNVRLIYWYWNPVKPQYSPNLISSSWEKWTFDKDDSIKYNMKYNGTYYFPIKDCIEKICIDIFFIGLDKGRYNSLTELQKEFEKLGFKTDFHIASDRKQLIKDKKYRPLIPYELVINKLCQSKSILELMQQNQTGLTLRTMEALFFSKKLITNNITINKYNFYNKDNIFIIGVDDFETLKIFLDTPFKKIEISNISQYYFENWKDRLVKNIELNDES